MTWIVALSMAASFALLAGCGLLAWKRRRAAGDRSGRAVRILLCSILPGLGLSLIVLMVSSEQQAEPVLFIPFMLVFAYLMSLPVVLLIELAAWRLRPIRSGRWLAAAMALFTASFVAVPVLISVLADTGSAGQAGASVPQAGEDAAIWIALDYLMAILAAALVWWSYLPPARVSVASLFE
jgi:hypothetical protein